jgi:hypothetical protein
MTMVYNNIITTYYPSIPPPNLSINPLNPYLPPPLYTQHSGISNTIGSIIDDYGA